MQRRFADKFGRRRTSIRTSRGRRPLSPALAAIFRRMTLFRLVAALAALTIACAFEAADPEPGAAFNKEELEKILRAEHSTKISNVYDSENGIQCATRATLRRRRR